MLEFLEMDAKQVRLYLSFYHWQEEDGEHWVECPSLRTIGNGPDKAEALRMCKEMTLILLEHCIGENTLEQMLKDEGWSVVKQDETVIRFLPPNAKPERSWAQMEKLLLSA